MTTKGLTVGLAPPRMRRSVPYTPPADQRLRGPVQPPTAFLPAGMLMPWAGVATAIPAGWLLCDGSVVSRSAYPALFAVIGHTYAADPGGGNFTLPNLKGRVIVGVDAAQTEFDVLGETGGSKTSTAPHTHDLASHTHTGSGTSSGPSDNTSDWSNSNDTGGGSGTTNWQSDTHSNYQHFHTANFIRVVYDVNNATHAHAGGANTGTEGRSGGIYYGANWTIDVNTTDTNHYHNTGPHSHSIQTHTHNLKNHTHTYSFTTSGPTGNTSGASSAGAASGNLPPYITMQYLIKT